MLEIAHRPDGWNPPIVRTVAIEGFGAPELLAALRQCRFENRKVSNWRALLQEMLRDRLLERVLGNTLIEQELAEAALDVAARRRNPYSFIDEVVARYERSAD